MTINQSTNVCNELPPQAPLTEAQLDEFFNEQQEDTNSEYKFMGINQPWEPAPVVPLMLEEDEVPF